MAHPAPIHATEIAAVRGQLQGQVDSTADECALRGFPRKVPDQCREVSRWVGEIDRIIDRVGIEIGPAREAARVLGRPASNDGVIVPGAEAGEPGDGVVFSYRSAKPLMLMPETSNSARLRTERFVLMGEIAGRLEPDGVPTLG
jgi:hypothetical protein